jgi:hypothetical protein
MNRKQLSVALILCFFLCVTAYAQQGESPRGEPAPDKTIKLQAGDTSDGVQPVVTRSPANPNAVPPSGVKDFEGEQNGPSFPLWQRLDAMSLSDKENAQLQLEIPRDSAPAILKQAKAIEDLWNNGNFNDAIDLLSALSAAHIPLDVAASISWKTPKVVATGSEWNPDVQVTTRGSTRDVSMDSDDTTGNIFDVVLRTVNTSTDPNWTVNTSFDNGQTWTETYSWWGDTCTDLSAGTCDQWLYVIYAAGLSNESCRSRRFTTIDGQVDNVYFWVEAFNNSVTIDEVALSVWGDTRLYLWAVQSDNSLRYIWDDQNASSWSEIATGITDADLGLDACTNDLATTHWTACSFVDTSDDVRVVQRGSPGFVDTNIDPAGSGGRTSIGAGQDHFMVVFEEYTPLSDSFIRYRVQYPTGTTFYWGYVSGTTAGDYYWEPHITGKGDGGFHVAYEEEVGEPDPVWYRWRPYPGGWSTSVQINDNDVTTGAPLCIEFVNPTTATYAYGVTWEQSNNAYFDRTDGFGAAFTLAVSPDPLVGGATGTFTVTNGAPSTATYLAYSFAGTGSTYVPFLSVTLGLALPKKGAGPTTSSASGGVIWSISIPNIMPRPIWVQAAQNGQATNVVATSIL